MPIFSPNSTTKIATLHPDLQRVVNKAILIMDFAVLDGLRDEIAQAIALREGHSKVKYPNSHHNRSKCDDDTYDYTVSDAVDCAPYPIKWPNSRQQTAKAYTQCMGRFYRLAGVMLAVAHMEGVKLRWGGDFRLMFDGPHFELIR